MKFSSTILALVGLNTFTAAKPSDNPFLYRLPANGETLLATPEVESNRFYRPPRSVVSFPVAFDKPVAPDRLAIRNGAGDLTDFQLAAPRSNPKGDLEFARIHISAQPGDAFTLNASNKPTEQSFARPLFAWQDGSSHFIQAGEQTIAIPKGPVAKDAMRIPGPIRSLDLGDSALPLITLVPGKGELQSVATKRTARGPLFTEYTVTYQFAKDASYVVTVRALRDTPFIAVSETITGLTRDDGVVAEIKLDGLALREGSRKRIGPGNPQLTLDTDDGKALALFSLDDTNWLGGSTPIALHDGPEGEPASLRWQIAAPQNGETATRHFALALHDPKAALASIAAHPPGRVPRSTDTLASWLYHYHTRLPLDATKDWQLEHESVRPSRLFKAYRIARLRMEQQYPELAEIASTATGHPMAAEWAAQVKASRSTVASNTAANLSADRSIDLGILKLERRATGQQQRLELDSGRYQVIVDTNSNGPVRARFPGQGEAARLVVVPGAGELSATVDKELLHVAPTGRSVAVIGAKYVNDTVAMPNFGPGIGITSAPESNPIRIGNPDEQDLVFVGEEENGRSKADGEGYAFDGEFGIISKDTLATFSAGDESPVTNRIASELMTLETEGVGVSASFYHSPSTPDAAVPILSGEGKFDAEPGGKLRLDFGPPKPAVYRPRGNLMAFWRFDETDGRAVANTKNPAMPAQIVGGESEPGREKGVAFDKVYAVTLDGAAHVETFFDAPLPVTHSILAWVKSKSPATIWTKAQTAGGKVTPGSRWMRIDSDGDAVATLALGEGVSELRGNAELLDGKWHHIAWIADAESQRLFVDGKQVAKAKATALPAPAAPMQLAGAASIPLPDGNTVDSPGLNGALDNVRVYNMTLRDNEIAGLHTVGMRQAPIVLTTEPTTTLRVGETFNYALEYIGAPYVQFRFIHLPEWMKFEGRLTGVPEAKHIGTTDKIVIAGLCPWGPAQQEFKVDVQPPLIGEAWKVYIDGRAAPIRYSGNGIEVELPAGEGRYEFTNAPLRPPPPAVLRSVEVENGLEVELSPSGEADKFIVELSKDEGVSWSNLAQGSETTLTLEPLAKGEYWLRAYALNGEQCSRPSEPFPCSVTREPPPSPSSPSLSLSPDTVELSWQPIAGAASYSLRRRSVGDPAGEWTTVYTGSDTTFADRKAKGTIPRFDLPGLRASVDRDLSKLAIYEYTLTATNAHGESPPSEPADTDPRRW